MPDLNAGEIDQLEAIVGAAALRQDLTSRRFYSHDIWTEGALAAAVVTPQTPAAVSGALAWANAAGVDVHVRGGGMSYTAGYMPLSTRSIVLDLAALNKIIAIDAQNMTVTAQCGVTWAQLDEALRPLGLRTPFWGPFSGRVSTIGGALSQNAVFFGSGLHGTAADSVLGMSIALMDGRIVQTGSAGAGETASFFRHYGPDLTGLFTGDAGAFGVKLSASLRLIPRPLGVAFASFDVEDRDGLLQIMHAIAREQLASECFAFDPFLQAMRLQRESLSKDFQALRSVLKAEGVGAGLKMAMAGRKAAQTTGFALHVACEDRSEAGAEARIRRVEEIAKGAGAKSVEATMPRVARAMPFGPLNGMLGAGGERWVPVHGVVAHSRAKGFLDRLEAFYARHEDAMREMTITSGYMLCTVQAGATLIEPVFYWPDCRMAIHEQSVAPDFLANLAQFPANPAARAFVAQLRQEIIEAFAAEGAIHFQVGKTYPCQDTRDVETAALLGALKRLLDPQARLNPGARTACAEIARPASLRETNAAGSAHVA